jgi:mRNA interferase RelE/StbE
MTWTVSVTQKTEKAIEKLDSQAKRKIQHFISELLPNFDNPRQTGKALQGDLKGLWRYRVGDYRLITQIKDHELIILVVELGHRKDIYK